MHAQALRRTPLELSVNSHPPLAGFSDGLRCAVHNVDAVGPAHDRGICCRTCEALLVPPRSASAIAASSLASSSEESSTVLSPSGARTVTVTPSGPPS